MARKIIQPTQKHQQKGLKHQQYSTAPWEISAAVMRIHLHGRWIPMLLVEIHRFVDAESTKPFVPKIRSLQWNSTKVDPHLEDHPTWRDLRSPCLLTTETKWDGILQAVLPLLLFLFSFFFLWPTEIPVGFPFNPVGASQMSEKRYLPQGFQPSIFSC